MSSDRAYIDVFTSTRVARRIDGYRATIEITVSTGRQQSCMQESLVIRDRVLAALSAAGLKAAEIEEGAGNLEYWSWSSTNRFSQAMQVRHEKISTLMQAMANVEQIVKSIDDGWFSRIRRDCKFGALTPEYSDNPAAAQEALELATANARLRATHLAAGLKVDVGDVLSIAEVALPRRSKTRSAAFTETSLDFDADDLLSDAGPAVENNPVPTPHGLAPRCFRVRFAVVPRPTAGNS